MGTNSHPWPGNLDTAWLHTRRWKDSNAESWAQGFMEQRAFSTGTAVSDLFMEDSRDFFLLEIKH